MTLQDIGHKTIAQAELDSCVIHQIFRDWETGRSSRHFAEFLRAAADYIEHHQIAVFDFSVQAAGEYGSSATIYGVTERPVKPTADE